MRIKRFAGIGSIGVAVLVAAATPVSAQELSEKAIRTFMDYAWSLVPAQFTKPNGQVIQIDKKKKEEVLIPEDVAREIIRVGRFSAHAQVCNLPQEQVDNYQSLMRREEVSKKWTPQQMIYINQLHLTTVMLLTGKIRRVEKEGDTEVKVEESKAQTQTCTDEERSKVKEVIAAYVKAGPPAPVTTGSTPAAAATATPAAQKK